MELCADAVELFVVGGQAERARAAGADRQDPGDPARPGAHDDDPVGEQGRLDMVGALLFLLGPGSDFVTGQNIWVNGGRAFN